VTPPRRLLLRHHAAQTYLPLSADMSAAVDDAAFQAPADAIIFPICRLPELYHAPLPPDRRIANTQDYTPLYGNTRTRTIITFH